MEPWLSLIIPAFNEAALLPRLLDSVDVARARYRGDAAGIEVIVVDNVSTDATAELARTRGCRVVRQEKRVIAAVRNAGAEAARGRVLAFIDADSILHADTFNALEAWAADTGSIAGATGLRMDRMSLGIAATFAVCLPIVWATGIDSGVVFCRKADFAEVGGYNEERYYAEDVQFLLDLKRLGKQRGQKLRRLKTVKAVTSARKFDRYGEWHYFRLGLHSLIGCFFASHSDRFVKPYWYDR